MLAYDVIGGSWHAVKMQYLQEVPQQGHRHVYCWWPGMIAFALLYYRVEHSHRPRVSSPQHICQTLGASADISTLAMIMRLRPVIMDFLQILVALPIIHARTTPVGRNAAALSPGSVGE